MQGVVVDGSVDLWVGRVFWRRLALDLNHLLSKPSICPVSSIFSTVLPTPPTIQGGLQHGYLMSPARDTLREEGGINIPFDADGSREYIPKLGISMNCGESDRTLDMVVIIRFQS
ncbi:hypothetical protein CEXT_328021 [Caerostris extrusa]|uniref:Uncharacterized protein n=1 Tax=Caerostris extrusa TaxID=172846 RepID=A0AAV4WRS0_CAEEX|nr:hypothetical protein CEXT_328021 [Caerostris extrusa]